MIDLPYRHHISIDLAVANLNLAVANLNLAVANLNLAVANLNLAVTNLDIEALGIAKMSRFSSEHPTFIAY